MKLRHIIASIATVVLALAGCTPELEPVQSLDGLEVSNDYFTLATDEGSSATITINGEEAWTINEDADWLSVSPTSGSAGQAVSVTFTATSASKAARKTEVKVVMGSKTKIINVNQDAPAGVEIPLATCADVFNGGDGNYKVRGTVTSIANTSYGNWYLNDGTVDDPGLYIYGTFNSKSQYPKDADGGWNSFGIEVGDIVTVEGPKSVYNGVIELVDVSIVKIEKSLIDASLTTATVGPDACLDTLLVSSKVQPILVSIDADWAKVVDFTADGNYLISVAQNTRTASRTANISIKAPGAIKSVTLTQEGVPATGASVTEIIAAADNDQVQTLPSTVVVALTTRGAVLSDGENAIYAYGNSAAALTIGDGVRMSAKKTTYNGVPELTDITDIFVDSQGNAVNYPTATDITANVENYTASVAEYIKFSGTLTVSGNYYNIAFDGVDPDVKQGSITYPVDALDAKSWDGKKITVTGFFNGLSSAGKYVNVIATKIQEFVDNPKGTVTNPYSASEIAALLLDGETFDEDVYIKGKVSSILYTFSANYGTGTFWISDDGVAYGVSEDKKKTSDPAHDFECYSVYWMNGEPWAEGNAQIEVGDEVVVCGKTTVYNGVAETSNKNAHVYSVNMAATDANGIGNAGSPFNIAGIHGFIDAAEAAKAAAEAEGAAAPSFPDVCVKGKISAILYTYSASYGTASFWISDDGTAYGISEDKKKTSDPVNDFECYSAYYLGGQPWVEGNDQIEVGDEVVMKGQYTIYNGVYETSSKKAYMLSHNGKTE